MFLPSFFYEVELQITLNRIFITWLTISEKKILVILFLALKFLKIFEKNQKIGNFIYTFSVLLESKKARDIF